MGIFDNFEDSELFGVSTRLIQASEDLQKLVNREPVSERAQENLRWARDLIGQVNWNSETYDLPTTPRMTCLATSVRPYVFAKLRQRKEYNFREFLDRVYSVLGQEELRATQETTQITEFIEQVSNWILSYLNSQNPVVV